MEYEEHQIGMGEVSRRLRKIEEGVDLVRKELSQEMGSMRVGFSAELKESRAWNEEHNSDLAKEINEIRIKIQVLEVTLRLKSGLWGAGSGIVTALLSVITYVLVHSAH